METPNPTYIKADDDKIINIKKIHWIKKYKECLYVCTRSDSCRLGSGLQEICKKNNIDSYLALNKHFE
jgi:hypothetical protein